MANRQNPFTYNTAGTVASVSSVPSNSGLKRVNYVDTTAMKQQLLDAAEAQKRQAINKIDQSVASSVNALKKAQGDAQQGFDETLKKVNIDEAKALDNQVLYSEARGDRGGIGRSQYGAIQNTAASNRLAVANERSRLQTDTEQKIAELQANGEFEKADKLLSISNTYLSKLQELEKWAYEKNVSADEFNAKLYQWETEYEQSVEKMQRDYDLQMQKIYASAGQAMIKNGINLTGEQLESIGWTEPQYMAYRYYNG